MPESLFLPISPCVAADLPTLGKPEAATFRKSYKQTDLLTITTYKRSTVLSVEGLLLPNKNLHVELDLEQTN